MIVRRKHIQELVEKILVEQKIRRAPVDVEMVAKNLKLEVRKEHEDGDISGFLYQTSKGNSPVIGVNNRHSPNRQRFTIAHELGHYMLHGGDRLHVDKEFEVKLRSSESSLGVDVDEMEANFFAAELLMPKSFLEQDIAELGSVNLNEDKGLKNLATKYQVSTQALTFRLANMGRVRL